MKSVHAGLLSAVLFAAATGSSALAVVTAGPGGSGVAVGSSSLIKATDLSDSYTLGVGPRTTLPVNAFPIEASVAGPAALGVEFTDGHVARSWPGSQWSISNDANAINGATIYPGSSGSGSATGMTQRGGGGGDWGVNYGLRNVYTVQVDAVSVNDRIDIVSSSAANTINGGLAVFFRKSGGFAGFGEIGLYNGVTETNTGLTTGIAINQWNNLAVKFDRVNNTAEFFVNEVSKGSVNLNTFNVRRVGGGPAAGEFFLENENRTIVFQPLCPTLDDLSDAGLASGTDPNNGGAPFEYEVNVIGVDENSQLPIRSIEGEGLVLSQTRTFKTPVVTTPLDLYIDTQVGPPKPLILGEPLTGWIVAGTVLVLAGVTMLARAAR